MRSHEACRQLLKALAVAQIAGSDEAEEEGDRCTEIVINDRETAGRLIEALASFIIYSFHDRPEPLDAEQAIELLAAPIPDDMKLLRPYMHTMLGAFRAGEKANETTARTVALITFNPIETAFIIWTLAAFVILGFSRVEGQEGVSSLDEALAGIDDFMEASVRQGFIDDIREIPDIFEEPGDQTT